MNRTPSDTTNLSPGARLLWIVPERLGDCLMTTAALAFLKRLRPDVVVNVCSFSPIADEIYRNNPHVQARHLSPNRRDAALLARDHDLLVHTHPDFEPEMDAFFGRPVFHPASPGLDMHQTFVQIRFIADWLRADLPDLATLSYELYSDPSGPALADELLSSVRGHPLVGCSIGCSRIAKRGWKFWKALDHSKVWSIRSLIDCAQRLRTRHPGVRFVLLGTGSERHLARVFRRAIPDTADLVGRTSLLEMAEVVGRTSVMVVSDSGLLHVACARHVPVIALHGPTDPGRTGPFPPGPLTRVIRRASMRDITPEEVCRAAEAFLPDR